MLATWKPTGEIDMATAPAFKASLFDAINGSHTDRIVIDLGAVTFMDSCGYHALADATAHANRHGRSLVLEALSPSSSLVIRLCDKNRELRVAP